MSFTSWLLGKPAKEREQSQLEAENLRLRRWCDKLNMKLVNARAQQEQLKDLRRIVVDQRIELYRFNRRESQELKMLRQENYELRQKLLATTGKP